MKGENEFCQTLLGEIIKVEDYKQERAKKKIQKALNDYIMPSYANFSLPKDFTQSAGSIENTVKSSVLGGISIDYFDMMAISKDAEDAFTEMRNKLWNIIII